jgi:hypothetical protein
MLAVVLVARPYHWLSHVVLTLNTARALSPVVIPIVPSKLDVLCSGVIALI